MDTLLAFINHYFDIVFARSEQANVLLAMFYTLLVFGALYLFTVVPSYFLSMQLVDNKTLAHRNFHNNQIRKEICACMVSILTFALLGGLTFYLLKLQLLIVKGDISLKRT